MVELARRERFLAELRGLGGQAGNAALRKALDWDEAVYREVRQALLKAGEIASGRGRGGSVRLADAAVSHDRAEPPSGGDSRAPPPPPSDFGEAARPLDGARAYLHADEAVQRPDAGAEPQFDRRRQPPRTYRYDSSLAPELSWDENPERPLAEWLLGLVAEAVAAGEASEARVFAEPRVWQGTGERFGSLAECVARLRDLVPRPFLDWAGKSERRSFSVPTLPLFVHERHSTQAILNTLESHRASGATLDLFGDAGLDVADRLDAYEHKGPWANRLVLGDALQVMNSFLEYEGMGGQVQMIYFDPPYGVKFNSNFQPFVRKHDVRHGADEHMSREPEMVKAYRDTWELGLHSYLTYVRDRCLLAKELLAESGSFFVQISDDNVHHVREVLDEVFGVDNFMSLITFAKTSGASSKHLASTADYLIWYAKSKEAVKYHQLYMTKVWGGAGSSAYKKVELPDGARRSLSKTERDNPSILPEGARIYRIDNLTSQSGSRNFPVSLEEEEYVPKRGYWKTNAEGMDRLIAAGRVEVSGKTLNYVRYFSDFSVSPINDRWNDTGIAGFTSDKIYVVQTNRKVVQRTMLMTTDPGDLVLDITCGSGTTAVVAEEWGRRWITVDISRVPVALARQRLLTTVFPWYRVKDESRIPASGFVYERKRNRKGEEVGGLVPRVTLRSVAYGEEPEVVRLVDRPEVDKSLTRVCGPFTVEATVAAALDLEEAEEAAPSSLFTGPVAPMLRSPRARYRAGPSPRAYLDRMIEVLRRNGTLRLPENVELMLEEVRSLADREYLHAEALLKNGADERVAIVFGPEDAAVSSTQALKACGEAMEQGFRQLFLFGFAIQAKAREMLDRLGIRTTWIEVARDVLMSDLLKTNRASHIFSVTGQPDVSLERAGDGRGGPPLYRVRLHGLDLFRLDEMKTKSIEADSLPCWMLDTNYNGMAFYASQVFFPKTHAWDNIERALRGRFADTVLGHLAGTESEPFAVGDQRCIAVKVIDERGNELMVVRRPEEEAA